MNRKSGPATQLTLHLDRAAVGFDEMTGDGESQACPAHFARASFVCPVETLEYSLLVRTRDPDTVIDNLKGNSRFTGRHADLNEAA